MMHVHKQGNFSKDMQVRECLQRIQEAFCTWSVGNKETGNNVKSYTGYNHAHSRVEPVKGNYFLHPTFLNLHPHNWMK